MATVVLGSRRLLARILLCVAFLFFVRSERVKQKIYEDIQSDMACFKRFNGTHEIGCTSKFRGNYGVVHLAETEEDLRWMYDKGPHAPYVLAIFPQNLSLELLTQAQESGKVSGVVVLVPEDFDPDAQLSRGFSGDSRCPNEDLGLYSNSSEYHGYCGKRPWNPDGTSLLYTSWNFPIFLVDNVTSIRSIVDFYDKFNKPGENGEPRSWPLCFMELKSNMFGTTNTEVCMRRRSVSASVYQPINFCDPLSDYNIWGTVKPMNILEDIPDKSVIVVAARMDATSMFDNISPGANSAVSGLVTLMAAAEALYKYKDKIMESRNDKNILFVIFQGESWGYIGSSRMVWNMEKGEFPFKYENDKPDQMSQVNFTHIDYYIELSQIGQGMMSADSQLFLHTDPISNADPSIKHDTDNLLSLFEMSANRSGNVRVDRVNESTPLPPASFQSFLKRVNLSGVVITDHKDEFKNAYYESVFDDYHNVKYFAGNESEEEDKYHKHITRVAGVLATALYTLITGNLEVIAANATVTNNLLYCYMKNVSCPMFQEFGEPLAKQFFNEKPAKMYVSVKGGESGRTLLTHLIFASFLGDEVDLNESDCKTKRLNQVNQLYYLKSVGNGTCIQSTVRKTEAMSPAFLIDGYDWQSGEYSTWTESGWQLMKVMIFLRPSVMEEVTIVCVGVASLILSLCLVYCMNSRADLLFASAAAPAAC